MRLRTIRRWALTGVMAAAVGIGGIGTTFAADATQQDKAQVTVAIAQAANGNPLAYQIVATNRGDGPAKNVVISVPFDANRLQVAGATFADGDSWVSKLAPGSLEIQTGKISSGGSDTTVIQFAPLPGQSASELADTISFRWSDGGEGGSGTSALPNRAVVSANITAITNRDGSTDYRVSAAGFDAGEPIVYWYSTADGTSKAVVVQGETLYDAAVIDARLEADNDGNDGNDKDNDYSAYSIATTSGAIQVTLDTLGMAPGTYTLVAQGYNTHKTAVGTFQVK